MKRKVVFFIKTAGLIGLLFSLLLSVDGRPLQAAEPIKIGVVMSLTGWGGFLGTPEKQAISVAVDQINAQGGLFGRQVKVYFEDDKSSATNATIAATKLIRDEKVCCILGASIVESCMAILPICERENVSVLPMAPLTIPLNKWVYLVPLTDYYLSSKMVSFAMNTLGAKKIASLHDSSTYGLKGAEGVRAHIAKYGATLAIDEQFDVQDTNVVPQLTKVRATHPDVIILFAPSPPAVVVAKNTKQLGLETKFVCGGGVASPEFPKLAGEVVEDGRWVFFSCMDMYAEQMAPDDPFRKNLYDPLMQGIKAKYGADTTWNGFYRNGYDNIAIALEGLKIAGTDDRAALRDALEKVKYNGFLGNFAYSPTDHQGTTGETFVPVIVKGGKYYPYESK